MNYKDLQENLIIVQQYTTVFSLLHFCRQLYMFRVLTPIIRRELPTEIINCIQSHIAGQLLNLIHDARTHEYKNLPEV
jgi:hypothetical protein